MSTTDFQAELTAAGANVSSRWDAVRFFIRRYPLGAAGAVIMVMFLFAAAFAPYITVYDPLSTNAADSLAKPGWQHWLGADFMGRDVYSRIIYGARISLAGVGRRDGARQHDRRHRRPVVRLSARLVRPGDAARARDDAGPAAARAGDHHGRGARSVAAQHDHRHRDPARALCRSRHPLEHAEPARAAVRRGRQGDRHVGKAHRASVTSCRIRWPR